MARRSLTRLVAAGALLLAAPALASCDDDGGARDMMHADAGSASPGQQPTPGPEVGWTADGPKTYGRMMSRHVLGEALPCAGPWPSSRSPSPVTRPPRPARCAGGGREE